MSPTPNAAQLRRQFLDYFAEKGHRIVDSAPLVPQNDPTLMFVNAGMVPFKDLFTGQETRSYKRATSSQRCMRVAGKHNDLDAVGRTARHHTFFEMLGNFSFGDYFKEGAIELAWEFLVQRLAITPDRLWITVFGGGEGFAADDEARALWRKTTGFGDERIISLGMQDNFWAMGDVGPCGPCTEIHFDLRPDNKRQNPPTVAEFEDGSVVEIWNNVFMQFERCGDGEVKSLPNPSVDTGMGLERLLAVVQGETSNYHTDLFLPIIEDIAAAIDKTYQRSDSEDDVAMRVIADHARATAFLVADGVQPSNEKRGYVMRVIMRRAIRFGRALGFDDLFFHRACARVTAIMGDAYPELKHAAPLVDKVARLEEQSFRRTLDHGLALLDKEIAALKQGDDALLPGALAFTLFDTHGFPLDLTTLIAEENGIRVDTAGYDAAMLRQQERSAGGPVGEAAVDQVVKALRQSLGATEFIGYAGEQDPLGSDGSSGEWRLHSEAGTVYVQTAVRLSALVHKGVEVDRLSVTDGPPLAIDVVLHPTPFYGEAGGQIGDRGIILGSDADDDLLIEVLDCQKPLADFTVCSGRLVRGTARRDAPVFAGYARHQRLQTRAHHSATHLLHGALRTILGAHVQQKGSYVGPDRLRFDYAHFEPPTSAQLRQAEDAANAVVRAAAPVTTEVLPLSEARSRGAIALFGEKYADEVRVITMGPSIEFCGGTHVENTADIGLILITKEEGVAGGVRRIEAEVADSAERTCKVLAQHLRLVLAMLGDPQKTPPESERQSAHGGILQAVSKILGQHASLAAELGTAAEGLVRQVAREQNEQAFNLPESLTLPRAQGVRDTWAILVKLTNTRAADALKAVELELERFPHLGQGQSTDGGSLLRQVAQRMHETRLLQRAAAAHGTQAQHSGLQALLSTKEEIDGLQVVMAKLDNVRGKELRSIADGLREQLGSGLICLVSAAEGKGALLIAATKDVAGRHHAGDLLRQLAPLVGGRGGGKPDMAQGGAQQPERAEELFESLRNTLRATPATDT